MTKIRIDYFGVEGEGRTVTEAKRDAGRKIEASLAGPYTPELFVHRGYAMLVYREPSGWHNRLVADPEDGMRAGKVWGTDYGTFQEAKNRALAHLADLGWTPDDGDTPPAFLVERSDIADYRSKVAFNVRYRDALARGLSRDDAHAYAGRAPGREDLWLATA